MKKIELTNGGHALVDDQDYDKVMMYTWYDCRSYAYSTNFVGGKLLLMHRHILDAPPHRQVDHIDMNGLNNQRSNLRLVTAQQNKWNKSKPRSNTSGYKGVTWNKNGFWQVRVGNRHIGTYSDPKIAAVAYDLAALKWFGEYARPNFSQEELSGLAVQYDKELRSIKPKRSHTSEYRGVSWDKARSKWTARIKKENKVSCLGRFEDEKEAAKAYNLAASEMYGEKAKLNDLA